MSKLLQQLGTPDYPHNPAEKRQGEPLNGARGVPNFSLLAVAAGDGDEFAHGVSQSKREHC
ncbi:MAG TPA: hypothetical protein VFN35_18985 [Ktedonobacteraceae bacterium]|nr:hypothetical protein [Ktedonobacteraceae bacterium]